MGFSLAWNDPERGILQLESFAATSSARGDATRFSVRNLPDARGVQVRRDDEIYQSWRATDSNSMQIETDVGDHRFEIVTGYRGAQPARAGKTESSEASSRATGGTIVRSQTTMSDIVTAVSTVSATCPCCAAG